MGAAKFDGKAKVAEAATQICLYQDVPSVQISVTNTRLTLV